MVSPVVWQPATEHGTAAQPVGPGVCGPSEQVGVTAYLPGRRKRPGAEPRGSGQPSEGTSVGGPRRGATVAVHKGR